MPICLTEVVLTAFSDEAFHAARTQTPSFENWLFVDFPILRQGEIHTFNAGLLPPNGADFVKVCTFRYRADMMTPVQQGYARKGTTRLIVTLEHDADRKIELSSKLVPSVEDDTASDSDGIEIDEGFLASSVLPPISGSLQDLDHYSNTNDNSGGPATSSEVGFHPLCSSHRMSDQDDYTLYLRTADLVRVGVLNGDWVSGLSAIPTTISNKLTFQGVARSNDISGYRPVHIIANDDLVPAP